MTYGGYFEEQANRFEELKSAARDRLGSLYNEADDPTSLAGLSDMAWDFPGVEPPDFLQQLNPKIHDQECQRVQARFDEAVRLAEAAFTEELAKLVERAQRVVNGVDPQQLRDSQSLR